MEQNESFSVESILKCCDIKRGGGEGVNVNVIMTLIFPQGLWTSPLMTEGGGHSHACVVDKRLLFCMQLLRINNN